MQLGDDTGRLIPREERSARSRRVEVEPGLKRIEIWEV